MGCQELVDRFLNRQNALFSSARSVAMDQAYLSRLGRDGDG